MEVRCSRCGTRAEREQPRARAEQVTYFCPSCRAAMLDQPALLPGYRLVRELGRGGMGAVYLAEEEATGTQRALKLVLPHAALSQKARRQLLQEATASIRLSHPRIVEVLALQESSPGVFCMVMEHVAGPSAAELLASAGEPGLEPELAAKIVVQALEGLGFAHRAGVVHREIKEANLLVGRDGGGGTAVKLSDFGLAQSFSTSGASGFLHAGAAAGALAYMAPEQILSFREIHPSADLYAMGVVLYRLLSGAYPLEPGGRDPFLAVLEDPIVPLARRRPGLLPGLAAVAERALEKRARDRFASAEEMGAAILAAR